MRNQCFNIMFYERKDKNMRVIRGILVAACLNGINAAAGQGSEEAIRNQQAQISKLADAASQQNTVLDISELKLKTLDLAPFIWRSLHSDSDRQRVVEIARLACLETGFFAIKNHGVSENELRFVYRTARAIFGLSRSAKEKFVTTATLSMRGWANPSSTEYGPDDGVSRVYKEAFHFGPDRAPYDRNVWPSSDFRVVMMHYYARMQVIENVVLQILARSLNLSEDVFTSVAAIHQGLVRLNYYDTRMIKERVSTAGFGAHTDWGTITILAQEKPGLEVLHKGRWFAVFPRQGELVVNLGDIMSIWTNGMYRSTIHRATMSQGETRVSIPYFGGHALHPHDHSEIEPLVSGESHKLMESTTMVDYIGGRYQRFERVSKL